MDSAGWLAAANVVVLLGFGVLSIMRGRSRPRAVVIYAWVAVLLLGLNAVCYQPGEPSVLTTRAEFDLVGAPVLGWYEGWVAVRAVLLLLLLLSFAEILREDFASRWAPVWVAVSAVMIIAGMLFPYVRVWSYLGGRIVVVVGGAVLLGRAVRERHPYLLALSLLMAGWLVTDIVKILEKIAAGTTFVPAIQVIQRHLDPAIQLIGSGLLVWAALQPDWRDVRARFERFTRTVFEAGNWLTAAQLSLMLGVPEPEAVAFAQEHRVATRATVYYRPDVERALSGL